MEKGSIPNELLRHILCRAKVPGRIEWQRRDDIATVCVEAVLSAADGEEGPSRWIARAGNAANVAGFEEVDFVDGAAVHGSGQDGQQLKQDTASEDYEGDEAHNCTCTLLADVIGRVGTSRG
jgi:hypothetical protein